MHTGQWAVWESPARYKTVVAGRRGGKSELGAMWTLAGSRQDALQGLARISWVVAPTFNLTRPLWRKFTKLAPPQWVTQQHGSEARPDFLELGPARIEFRSAEDPTRLVAEGLGRLWMDEGGTVKERAWTESLLPTLIDHKAPALLTGTPKGQNWFYRMWLRGEDPGDPDVQSFRWTSYANPFIDAKEIDRIAAQMPERLHRQEIMAEFLTDEGAVFRGVRKCVGELSPYPTMVIGIDLARVKDFTVLHGLDANGVTTFWDRFREIDWPLQKGRIAAAAQQREYPLIVMDANSVGDPIVQDLQKIGLTVHPYQFTLPSKQRLVEALVIGIEQGKLTLPEEPILLNELEAFEFTTTPLGNIRYGAPEGLHDDCVIALGLAYWGLIGPGHTVPALSEEIITDFHRPNPWRDKW